MQPRRRLRPARPHARILLKGAHPFGVRPLYFRPPATHFSNIPTAPIARLGSIPEGKAGMIATLRAMRQFARDAVRDPAQKIRTLAIHLTHELPPRSYQREVKRLHEFVRDEIRYVRDPAGVELVSTPARTLEIRAGDCDDKSVLLAALLESLGHPAQFKVIGLNGGPFSHVFVETKIGHSWVPLETIINRPMGWYPNGITSHYILKV